MDDDQYYARYHCTCPVCTLERQESVDYNEDSELEQTEEY